MNLNKKVWRIISRIMTIVIILILPLTLSISTIFGLTMADFSNQSIKTKITNTIFENILDNEFVGTVNLKLKQALLNKGLSESEVDIILNDPHFNTMINKVITSSINFIIYNQLDLSIFTINDYNALSDQTKEILAKRLNINFDNFENNITDYTEKIYNYVFDCLNIETSDIKDNIQIKDLNISDKINSFSNLAINFYYSIIKILAKSSLARSIALILTFNLLLIGLIVWCNLKNNKWPLFTSIPFTITSIIISVFTILINLFNNALKNTKLSSFSFITELFYKQLVIATISYIAITLMLMIIAIVYLVNNKKSKQKV